jgi:hypothetical protein
LLLVCLLHQDSNLKYHIHICWLNQDILDHLPSWSMKLLLLDLLFSHFSRFEI